MYYDLFRFPKDHSNAQLQTATIVRKCPAQARNTRNAVPCRYRKRLEPVSFFCGTYSHEGGRVSLSLSNLMFPLGSIAEETAVDGQSTADGELATSTGQLMTGWESFFFLHRDTWHWTGCSADGPLSLRRRMSKIFSRGTVHWSSLARVRAKATFMKIFCYTSALLEAAFRHSRPVLWTGCKCAVWKSNGKGPERWAVARLHCSAVRLTSRRSVNILKRGD